jgi:predicted nucleic acid-binding OB-fold protein
MVWVLYARLVRLPLALRLKELEVLERIAEKIDRIQVNERKNKEIQRFPL